MNPSASNITPAQIALFLAKTELFGSLPKTILEEMATAFEVTWLAGSNFLFHQHDRAESLYVLMFGFLRVLKKDDSGEEYLVNEIGAGSIVGEIGCLFDEPRTASIRAVRDSVLLKMSRATFDTLLEKHPMIMMGIARQCVKRLVSPQKHAQKSNMTCFSLIPAGTFAQMEQFSHQFAEALSQYGETLLLNEAIFDQIKGDNASQAPLESAEVIGWIQELESRYRFLVFVATHENPWAQRCIRQADKILLIGQHGTNPSLGKMERFLFAHNQHPNSRAELILLCDDNTKRPVGSAAWFVKRHLAEHHHLRSGKNHDMNRLVRLVTNNGLGLVLSGGGALALAHIGVLIALKEANIPIDYIGGTSMGALVAAKHALEVDPVHMPEMFEGFLSTFRNKLDYTLPISALVRGKLMGQLIRDAYGSETMIEDLWQKFFCVSTNISSNELYTHDHGLIWKALRKSISLPGIFPYPVTIAG